MHTLESQQHAAPAPHSAPRTRRRTGVRLTSATALAAAVALGGIATPALAHDELVGQRLVLDDVDSVSAVQLSFSDEVLTNGTEIAVTDPEGTDVTDGAPEHNGRDVDQPVADDLEPGEYRVVWRVVSSDGHPIEGAFVFDLENPASENPEFRPFDPSEPTGGDEATENAETEDTARDASTDGAGYVLPALIGLGAIAAIGAVVVIVLKNRKRPGTGAGESHDRPLDGPDTRGPSDDR